MRERRSVWVWCGVALAAAVLGLLALQPAGAKSFKTKDLSGNYHYTVSEVRIEGAEIEYCDSFGTIFYDGAGYAEVLAGSRRCTLYPSGTVTDDPEAGGEFSYEVFSNGEFVMTELDEFGNPTVYVTHGRLLQRGQVILVDGTLRHSEVLSMHAVAAKE